MTIGFYDFTKLTISDIKRQRQNINISENNAYISTEAESRFILLRMGQYFVFLCSLRLRFLPQA